LFEQYGFVVENNPFDSVMILAPFNEEDELLEPKLAMLKKRQLPPRYTTL
jgi:hypothetical protein